MLRSLIWPLVFACAGSPVRSESTPISSDHAQPQRELSGLFVREAGGCVLDAGVPICWGPALAAWSRPVSPSTLEVLGVVDQVLFGETELCTLARGDLKCWKAGFELSDLPTRVERDVERFFLDRTGGCFLRRGAVTCWVEDQTHEVVGSFVDIAGTDRTSCGITPEATVRCWRQAEYLGGSDAVDVDDRPAASSSCGGADREGSVAYFQNPAQTPFVDARTLVVGDESICVRVSNGQVRCVGAVAPWSNDEPTWLVPNVVADELDMGAEHVCARREDRVRCWGVNHHGQHGSGNTLHEGPVEVLLVCGHSYASAPAETSAAVTLSDVRELALGPAQTCAIAGDTVQCVGRNLNGAFGRMPTHRPGLFPARGQKVIAGGILVCAFVDDEPRCLVGNRSNHPNFGNRPHEVPWAVADLAGEDVATCILDVDGLLHCGYYDPASTTRLNGVAQVAVGGSGLCARMTDGGVRCWSRPPTPTESPSEPTPVDGVSDATDIGVGAHEACAIRDGRVWCWGEQEGLAELGSFTDAVELSLNRTSTCVRRSTGAVSCRRGREPLSGRAVGVAQMAAWGSKRMLLASNGSVVDESTLEPVTELRDIDQLVAGNGLFCAHDRADRIWCWGENGALGRRPDWAHVRPVTVDLPP